MDFYNLRGLANKLGSHLVHPAQVCTKVQLAPSFGQAFTSSSKREENVKNEINRRLLTGDLSSTCTFVIFFLNFFFVAKIEEFWF